MEEPITESEPHIDSDVISDLHVICDLNVISDLKPNIKHLVICGGGVSGFTAYRMIKERALSGFLSMDAIQSIYGTSVGAILAVMFALKYSWEDIDIYLVKRPWQNVFKFDIQSLLYSYENRGIFDQKVIYEILHPLLLGKGLDVDITMREFFDYTGIDIHVNTTELHSFENIDISHKTHPDWKVCDAVYCSACLPILFSPFLVDDKCYIDGGVCVNYALNTCLENVDNPDEIFGITLTPLDPMKNIVRSDSNLFDYMSVLFNKIHSHSHVKTTPSIKYEEQIDQNKISIFDILELASSIHMREELIAPKI
jgi:predicted acylesterase/phospholipase RssA